MLIFVIALFLFFPVRTFAYNNGRAFAGVFASLECLLFLGGIYVDFAGQVAVPAEQVRSVSDWPDFDDSEPVALRLH